MIFCGLHFLVGLTDQTEASLKAWDRLLYDDRPVGSLANGGYSKGESGTLRLIRTTCKAVQTHGCERSGRISDFYTFLWEEVCFSNVLLFLLKKIILMCYFIMVVFFTFFIKSVKDENKLLKAVHSDLQIKSYLCGCRALGLINKFVTGSL